MQSRQLEKWGTILGSVFTGTDIELFGVECMGGGKRTLLRVYIDKPGGINIDDIAGISREISMVLEVEEPIKGAYTLEVSSPGLDRPLFKPEQFNAQIEQTIQVKLSIPIDNQYKFKGTLKEVDGQKIILDVEGKRMDFAFDDIEKAKVIPHIAIGAQGNKGA